MKNNGKKREGTPQWLKLGRLSLSNFRVLHDIEILFDENGLIQFTGAPSAGKTTILKGLMWMIKGPVTNEGKEKEHVVRTGSGKVEGLLELLGTTLDENDNEINDPAFGHYIITRSETLGGTHDCKVIDQRTGEMVLNKQDWLKSLITTFSFDPLEFSKMEALKQIEALKQLAHLDFDALEESNKIDTEQRKELEAEARILKQQADGIELTSIILADLPEQKLDERAVELRLSSAKEANREADAIALAKKAKGTRLARAQQLHESQLQRADDLRGRIEQLRRELESAEKGIVEAFAAVEAEQAEYDAAPDGEKIDTEPLVEELESVRRKNRYIEIRSRWNELTDQHAEKMALVKNLENRINARDNQKAQAIANLDLPVKGLSFETWVDNRGKPKGCVYYTGSQGKLPLTQYGEAERIRISTLLGIHLNPDLHAMCIDRGESLGKNHMKLIEDLAIEHKFQILMSRVEESGEIGFVVDKGRIVKNNTAREKASSKSAQPGPIRKEKAS